MQEHAVKVSVTKRFETTIAESSKTASNLWKISILEVAKVGATLTEQEIQSFKNLLDQSRFKVLDQSTLIQPLQLICRP